jgi:hypothetical protein
MGNVYKPGRVFWIQYYRHGLKIRESAETSSETEARQLLKIREGDIARGLPVTNRNLRRTFKELLDDVVRDYTVNQRRSLASLKSRIDLHLKPWWGNLRASYVDTARIKQYTAFRLQEGASPASVNPELTVIQRAFETWPAIAESSGPAVCPEAQRVQRAKATGHRTREVFERYNIVSNGDIKEAGKKLDGHIKGTIGQSLKEGILKNQGVTK